RLDSRPPHEAIGTARLSVRVTDGVHREGLPCRITVVNQAGTLMPVLPEPNQKVATRPGVIYTANGEAKVRLLPGEYTVYATRGFEYGLARKHVRVGSDREGRVSLALRREVPTPGWVSCDTHVHTFTLSRHGDASIEERVITLAGE